jgi:FkbM family methyltransferase
MKPTYIWGAGHYGVLTALDCEQKNIKIAGFIDSNANKIKTRLGLPVLEPSSIINKKDTFIYISVANVQVLEQIYFQLSELKLEFLQDFDISPLLSSSTAFSGKIPYTLIQRHSQTIKHPVFLRHPSTDLSTYKQIFSDFSYNCELTFEPDIIVDAGANIGLASVYFANKYSNAKIISIEPEKNNFEMLKKNIANYKNITPLNAALWNKNEEVCVIDINRGNDSFQVGKSAVSNSFKTDGFTIEKNMDMFNLPKIDLLKIDIEGAEKEVFENPTNWLNNVNTIAIELHERLKSGCNRSFYKGTTGYFSFEKSVGETVWLLK